MIQIKLRHTGRFLFEPCDILIIQKGLIKNNITCILYDDIRSTDCRSCTNPTAASYKRKIEFRRQRLIFSKLPEDRVVYLVDDLSNVIH